ncbi:carboxypeptidase regulatory-like domain-containing protein [Hymenobacter sp.]|uniref:carboxypeptidase regulatory-like domain-containing protein n=1 Tax=Hymenobacter sp. TaxID=1898978 RepID=UPI00286AFC62|nr:carboxypeptidase regulatory-like domain-containing protein [Hymenobacter sp.]
MKNLPMSQSDLALLLPLAWQHYLDHQPKFGEYKASYSPELAATALARLKAAEALPDEAARGARAEMTRGELLEQGREFLAVWQQLDGYIEGAFPAPTAYKAMREAAGYGRYEGAADSDWPAMTALINSALGFVAAQGAALRAGEMPEAFAARLAAEAADVQVLIGRFNQETAAAQQGTSARGAALLACFEEFVKMGRDGQRIFLRQPEVARLFQTDYLLSIVRGTGQAGVRGTLTLADGAPAAGVAVAVSGPRAGAAVSDADGRYALALPAGDYTVAFSGAGFVPQEVAVTVEAGVKRRVDGVMGRVA